MFRTYLSYFVFCTYFIKNSQLSFFIVGCSWVHKHASVLERTMNVCDHRPNVSKSTKKVLNNSNFYFYWIHLTIPTCFKNKSKSLPWAVRFWPFFFNVDIFSNSSIKPFMIVTFVYRINRFSWDGYLHVRIVKQKFTNRRIKRKSVYRFWTV